MKKRIFVMVILIISLVYLNGCTMNSKRLPTGNNCIDSDHGKNFAEKGTINIQTQDELFTSDDQCNGQILSEWYCEDEHTSDMIEFNCPYDCYDGSCLSEVGRCQFSDDMPCIDKVIITDNSIEIALRNNFFKNIELNNVVDNFCKGNPQITFGLNNPFEELTNHQLSYKDLFRIKLQDCTFESSKVYDQVNITYTDIDSGMKKVIVGTIISNKN